MSRTKKWVVLDRDNYVVHGFDATEYFVSSFVERVVEREDLSTPPWYSRGIQFVNVDNLPNRPVVGFYRANNGDWLDRRPNISVDRDLIPADGKTAATVTYEDYTPSAPPYVTFDVNGSRVEEYVLNGTASIEITSASPSDRITVGVEDFSVTIDVEGV
jgi:hypothetical protein